MSPFSTVVLLLLAASTAVLLPSPSLSDTVSKNCDYTFAGNYTANSTFQSNLLALLSNLSSAAAAASGFRTATSGSIPDRIYGLALCRGDASALSCGSCLSSAASDLPDLCPYRKSAVVWHDLCFLHYSDTAFAGFVDFGIPSYLSNTASVSSADASRFNQSILSVLDRLRDHAVTNATDPDLFAAGLMPIDGLAGFEAIYGLVQCTRDVSAGDCDRCLKGIFRDLGDCCSGPAIGGRVLAASCSFRYESAPFYNWSRELVLSRLADTPPPPPPSLGADAPSLPPSGSGNGTVLTNQEDKENKTPIILAIVIPLSIAAALVLVIGCFCFWKTKIQKTKRKGRLLDVVKFEYLMVGLPTIRSATNNFSHLNKLGESGYGAVYKGVLPDGHEIAVKRIAKGSVQGIEHLENEVVLLAKLQHRNLVRILGVCFEGDEKMLIYEYLANKSMDTILFDPLRKQQLNWDTRFRIIMGIARGLQYLHEESQIKIIHRDLKASNILLDGQLNPKISDFGTARLFGGEQTHVCTNTIVGTFGYMPPEYVTRGHYSDKTDVFSFGILVLEIVTGYRNSDFLTLQSGNSLELLGFVWEHWSNGSILEVVDDSLKGNFREDEVILCIQIGLRCVQELPADRPTISSIVLMLNSNTISLEAPRQPSLIHSSILMDSTSHSTYISKQSNHHEEAHSENDTSVTELGPR